MTLLRPQRTPPQLRTAISDLANRMLCASFRHLLPAKRVKQATVTLWMSSFLRAECAGECAAVVRTG